MELAVVGELAPGGLAPGPFAVVGGFRLYELAALALCHLGKPVIYVRGPAPALPSALECPFELRVVEELPPDVPAVEAGVVPFLLRSLNLRCGGSPVRLDPRAPEAECTPLESLADALEANVEVMRTALGRLEALGVELVRGDVAGTVRGPVYVRGKVYEYVYVEGPAVVGPRSEVLPFTYVRPGSVLYSDARARDELKNAVLDSYARKPHGGYLGDTYVGPFANLGAGTTVSNLKNTLGPIRPSYSRRPYRKLGPVLGDFVKSAIGTLIYGGRWVGPLSHVYGVVDRDVPPLSIYRDGRAEAMDPERAREYLRRDLAQFGRGDLEGYFLGALAGRDRRWG